MDATFVKKNNDAHILFTTPAYFIKKSELKLTTKHASIRLFYALIFSEKEVDLNHYIFTKENTNSNTIKNKGYLCKCEIDPLFDGSTNIPPFLVLLKEHLLKINENKLKAQELYNEVSKTYRQSFDNLHLWKGTILYFLNANNWNNRKSKKSKIKEKECSKSSKKKSKRTNSQKKKRRKRSCCTCTSRKNIISCSWMV